MIDLTRSGRSSENGSKKTVSYFDALGLKKIIGQFYGKKLF